MHWRNRLKGYSENIDLQPTYHNFKTITTVANFETILEETVEENITNVDEGYPEKIILQVSLSMKNREDNKSAIKCTATDKSFFIYKEKGGVVKKAISSITLNYDLLLSSFDDEDRVAECIEKQLYQKDFESLSFGEHVFDDKKRLPQNEVLEQSLWSYGAIYTPECDICQLIQYDFFPVFLNEEIKVKFVKREDASSLLDDIIGGCIKIRDI